MSALKEKFDQLIAEQEELRKKFQETAQALFKETTKEFFDGNPGIQAIIWTQYTPYFNDGDTCEFSVNSPTFTNSPNGEDVSPWGEYEGDDENVWATDSLNYIMTSDSPYHNEIRAKIEAAGGIDVGSCNAFERLVQSSAMEDVMQAMFGDHVKIIATRDGFDVDDYYHD